MSLLVLLFLLVNRILQLYDHRKETLDDFTHRELVNLVRKPGYEKVIRLMRARLVENVKNNNIFRGCYRDG